MSRASARCRLAVAVAAVVLVLYAIVGVTVAALTLEPAATIGKNFLSYGGVRYAVLSVRACCTVARMSVGTYFDSLRLLL